MSAFLARFQRFYAHIGRLPIIFRVSMHMVASYSSESMVHCQEVQTGDVELVGLLCHIM